MPNEEGQDCQQQTPMKFQITNYNQSYNELNSSYETKIMEHEESAHFSFSLLSPLIGIWHFETINLYPQHIKLFHPPTRFQEVLQKDNSNPNHQLQVTMILFRTPIEMGTPSLTPNPYSIPKMHHLSFPSHMPQSNHS